MNVENQTLIRAPRIDRWLYRALPLFMLTFSGLALEVALTRLFSVIYLQGYVYLLVSLSMAGLGLGAILVYYLNPPSQPRFFRLLLLLPLMCFGFLVGISLLAASFILALIPTILLFVCIGASTTFLFQRSLTSVPVLYFIDLCGAAAGAVACYYLLNLFGAVKTIIIFLTLISLAAGLISRQFFGPLRWWWLGYPLLAAVSITLCCVDLTHIVSPRYNRLKDMSRVFVENTDQPRITETRWTAFGRSDLVETTNPLVKTLYLDGSAGTKMLRMEDDKVNPALERALLYEYIGGIPLLPIPEDKRGDAVVIGSGGGIDVTTMLVAGYRHITAVEINRDFIEMVRADSAYNGGIYSSHPRVSVVHQEGRSFLRSSRRRYDLIHMSLPIIKSARNTGSYALVENHLFTWEAFDEYWRALKTDGQLIVVAHYPGEAYRLVTNFVKSMNMRGFDVEEAMRHLVLVGRDTAPALIVRKTAFTETDAESYYGMIRVLHQEGSTNFIPHVSQHQIRYQDPETGALMTKPVINELMYALSRGEIDLNTFIETLPENASWISDDSPFFYQMDTYLPPEVAAVAGITALLLLMLYLFWIVGRGRGKRGSRRRFQVFGLIGAAFMAIEIATIQQFVLFLGHETLSLSVLLSIILLSTGMGSYVSGRMRITPSGLRISLILALIGIAMIYFLGRYLVDGMVAVPLPQKTTAVAMLLFPTFFLLGFPFPTLLGYVRQEETGGSQVPWMIGANSLATLLGGSLSIAIAMLWGYSKVFLVGSVLYGLVVICLPTTQALELKSDKHRVSTLTGMS